eukprot:1066792-Ditylum_brightwellii.AAC.1
MKWTKGELRNLDIKTRNMLTMKGIHHPECQPVDTDGAKHTNPNTEIPSQVCLIPKIHVTRTHG